MPINYNQQINPNLDYQGLLEQLGRDREFINNYQQVEPSNRYKRMLQQELAYQAKDNGVSDDKLVALGGENLPNNSKPNIQSPPSNKELLNKYNDILVSNDISKSNNNLLDAYGLSEIAKTSSENRLTNVVKGIPYNDRPVNNSGGNVAYSTNPYTFTGSITYQGNRKDIQEKIVSYAQRYGFENPAVFLAIASQESDFNPNAQASTSSCKGLFQMQTKDRGNKKSTWSIWGKGKSVFDPDANIDAMMRFTQHNVNYWKQKTGNNPNYREIYLMHFLGHYGGVKAFKNPNAPIDEDVLSANRFLVKAGARTNQDLMNIIYNKIDKKVKKFMG